MIPVGILTAANGSNYDPDALAFFNRVTAAGGTLSNNEKTAVNTLVLNFKSAGIWSLMKAIYPMVGASAASCAQNLVSSSFTGTFSGGWTFSSNGATPNGTTAYMNTFFNPSNFASIDNFHISYYSRTQNITFNGGCMGQGDIFGSYVTYLAPYYASESSKFFITGSYPANATKINNTTTTGLILGNKSASNSRKLFLNSTLLVTNTTTKSEMPEDRPFFLGGLNYGAGTVSFPTAFQCAFASLGDSFTDAQEASFYNCVQAFQTALSRQV